MGKEGGKRGWKKGTKRVGKEGRKRGWKKRVGKEGGKRGWNRGRSVRDGRSVTHMTALEYGRRKQFVLFVLFVFAE